MAISGQVMRDSGVAGANALTSTAQFSPCYISAANTYSLVNTTTTQAVGVVESFASATSEAITVIRAGKARVRCSAAITAGDYVVTGAPVSGGMGVASDGTTATALQLGQALSSGVTNTVIDIWI